MVQNMAHETPEEVQIFYNDFFQTKESINEYSVAKRLTIAISSLMDECHGNIALDIGSGPGRLTELLSSKFNFVIGVDISQVAVRLAWRCCRFKQKCNFVVCDANHLPFKSNSLDIIVMSEVLEHLYSEQQLFALKEVRRLLQPSGQFILTTPNRLYFEVRRLLYKLSNSDFDYGQIIENQLYPGTLLDMVRIFFRVLKKKGVFFSIPIMDLHPIAVPLNNTIVISARNWISEILENRESHGIFFGFAQHQCLLCSPDMVT